MTVYGGAIILPTTFSEGLIQVLLRLGFLSGSKIIRVIKDYEERF